MKREWRLLLFLFLLSTPLYSHGVAVFTIESIRIIGLIISGALVLLALLSWSLKIKVVPSFLFVIATLLMVLLYGKPVISSLSKRIETHQYESKKKFFRKNYVKYNRELEAHKNDAKKSLALLKKFKKKLLQKGVLVKKDDVLVDIFNEEKYHNRYKKMVVQRMLYLTTFIDGTLVGNRELEGVSGVEYNSFYKNNRSIFTSEQHYINFFNQYTHYQKSLKSYRLNYDIAMLMVNVLYEKQYKKAFRLLLPLLPSKVLLKSHTLESVLMVDSENNSSLLTEYFIKQLDYAYSDEACNLEVIKFLYFNLQGTKNLDKLIDIAFNEFTKECSSREINLYISEDKRECDLYLYSKKRVNLVEIYSKFKDLEELKTLCD